MSDKQELMPIDDRGVVKAAPAQPVSTDPMSMLSMAIERGLDVDAVKGILDLVRSMKADQAKENFFKALSKFQASYPEIKKSVPVYNKDKKSVRYWYASLDNVIDSVRQTLKACGFSFIIKDVPSESRDQVTAMVVLHHKDGHEENSTFTAPIDPEAYMNAPQKVASARTFAKRQAFLDVTGIVPGGEDDDAISADEAQKYADYLNALDSENDITELFNLTKRFRQQLMEAKDTRGAEIGTQRYTARKEQIG